MRFSFDFGARGKRLLWAVVTLVLAFALSPEPGEAKSRSKRGEAKAAVPSNPLLKSVSSWGYQLRFINPFAIPATPYDVLVIDHAISANRRHVREFTTDEIALMQRKADGSRRAVLSYMSIGEAERYRFYWSQEWYDANKKPDWLGDMNPEWDGNYIVKFWERDWQRLIFGQPDSYLERIVQAGFDGVYLDRADIFLEWAQRRPDAQALMIDFIVRLIAHARRLKPDFIVVMQNAEELLENRNLRQMLDGIAKEDLFYGVDHRGSPNKPDDVDWTVKLLSSAKKAGLVVLVVEYLNDPEKKALVRRRATKLGYVPHFAPRGLETLNSDESIENQTIQPKTSTK